MGTKEKLMTPQCMWQCDTRYAIKTNNRRCKIYALRCIYVCSL